MLNLFQIINQAYTYTKSHKNLWFFGLFLTSWGGMTMLRRIDFNFPRLIFHLQRMEYFIKRYPLELLFWLAAALLLLFVAFLLGAVSRTVLIRSTENFSNNETQPLKKLLARNKKNFFQILLLSFSVNAILFFIAALLLLPLYMIFSKGLIAQGVVFSLAASGIYVPIAVVLSLANIFAACFVIISGMPLLAAVRAAFDLIASRFDKIVALLFALSVIYALSFIFGYILVGSVRITVMRLIGYSRQLALSGVFDIIVLVFALLAAAMLAINAVLNVFANIVWTLFFLEAVNTNNAPQTEKSRTLFANNWIKGG